MLNKTFSLLFIGNSFSDDTIEYMYDIAKEFGYDVIIENLYIGGCSLSTHLGNIVNNKPNYELRFYVNNKWNSKSGVTIKETLEKRKWDYISLQQVSSLSGMVDKYDELDKFYKEILKYVLSRDTKFIWNMTWAYQEGYEGLYNYNNSQINMFNGIKTVINEIIKTKQYLSLIIPTGTAIQNARTSSIGDTWNRDGFHLDLNKGRFIASLCAFKAITNEDITNVSFAPKNVSEKEREIVIEAVNNAFKYPLQITSSNL